MDPVQPTYLQGAMSHHPARRTAARRQRPAEPPVSAPVGQSAADLVLALQRGSGNRAVSRILSKGWMIARDKGFDDAAMLAA
jgi:hypothetical protein